MEKTTISTDKAQSQMRKGILEYCILSVLSANDLYASDILNILKEAQLIVVEGTIYPLLTRQKNAGLLEYRWEESKQGPPRKYYSLTIQGKEYLRHLDIFWSQLVRSVSKLRNLSTT